MEMNELWPEYDMDESQSNVELKKESIEHIYYLCHGHKKQSYSCSFML